MQVYWQMELRYGTIDENVKKRSVRDVILRERQRIPVREGRMPSGVTSLPVMFGQKRAGDLAVIAAVNDLAAQGIRTTGFSPTILLPPGTEEEFLRILMRQICRTAFSLGIDVREGCTEVTDLVSRPVVIGTASGIPISTEMKGTPFSAENKEPPFPTEIKNPPFPTGILEIPFSTENREIPFSTGDREKDGKKRDLAGMDIVMAGYAGLEGTFILADEYEEELADRFSGSLLYRIQNAKKELCIAEAAERAFFAGAGPMVSLAGGGVLAGLWELCKKTGCGMEADLPLIPLLQETIEITEYFGIDPYALQSGGGLLIAAPDGENIVRRLSECGIYSAWIGRLTGTKDKILLNGEEVRHLDRPRADSLTQVRGGSCKYH